MKKIIYLILLGASLTINCSKSSDSSPTSSSGSSCGTYKSGQQLYLGPQGGCYYISSGGNKEYVERSACSCK